MHSGFNKNDKRDLFILFGFCCVVLLGILSAFFLFRQGAREGNKTIENTTGVDINKKAEEVVDGTIKKIDTNQGETE